MNDVAVPDIHARLHFLQSPEAHAAYAPECKRVETIETHMSWVFLAGKHALKLKKAVRYDFLDFSTLSSREHYCREELRLNARLAPGVYRGLLSLRWQAGGLALVPEERVTTAGLTLDWLVLMRRLPAERMLDRLIANAAASGDDIDALATVLVDFYRSAPVVALEPSAYLGRFERELALDRELMLRPQFGLRGATSTFDRVERVLAQHGGLLCVRAAAGCIVDGHGDLRPEHVCMQQPPVVIDCLEFNPPLRQVDAFDELAFLGLECEMAGAAWVGPRLVARCAAALGDSPPTALLQLYAACRALLRARLALAHLLDPHPRTPGKWQPQAQRYLDQSQRWLDALERGAALNATRSRGSP